MAPETIAFLIVEEALKRALSTARFRWPELAKLEPLHIDVRLGCGATFSYEQRCFLRDIATRLGFADVAVRQILDEPIAAGISYARIEGVKPGRVLIYDFGGGTFDTALVDVGDNSYTVLAADGVQWLGGDDVDAMIEGHFLSGVGRDHGLSASDVKELLSLQEAQELQRRCTEAKETLSDHPSYADTLFSDLFGMVDLDLTRAQLESLVTNSRCYGEQNLIDRSLQCVYSVCRVAQTFLLAQKGRLLDPDDIRALGPREIMSEIDSVALVGGLTRMPLIRNRIAELFGEDKVVDQKMLEPMSAVALGASYGDSEHFSLLYPPYSVQLVLSKSRGGEDQVLCLHHAYDKLGFFDMWPSSTRPLHRGNPISVAAGYPFARLRFVDDGGILGEIEVSGAILDAGPYLCVDLAGRVQLSRDIVFGDELCCLPRRHHWQEEIVRLEALRHEEERARAYDNLRNRDRTVYTEN